MRTVVSGMTGRVRAALAHFCVSLVVAAVLAAAILLIWYPSPYGQMAGGIELFWIVILVDVGIGPALTLVVFDILKPRAELVRDVAIIAVLQLAAFVYGTHTVFAARPVALVFEIDRFRVVAANQVLESELPNALPQFRSLSLTGPRLLSIRQSRGDETLTAIDLALQGFDTGQRPSYWISYRPDLVSVKAAPLSGLLERYPLHRDDLKRQVQKMALSLEVAYYVPVLARKDGWVAVVDNKGNFVGFLQLPDSYGSTAS